MTDNELAYYRLLHAECRTLLDVAETAKRSGRGQDWHVHDEWEEEQWAIAIAAMALYRQAHIMLENFEQLYTRPRNR